MKPAQGLRHCLLMSATTILLAQNTGITRTVVTKDDISIPGREAVITRVEIAGGGSSGPYTHPGEELSYILEGQAEILVDGKAPKRVKAGDGSFRATRDYGRRASYAI